MIEPKLRFKGFDESWLQSTLGDLSEKVIDKNSKHQYNTIFTNSAQFGIIDQQNFFDHDIVSCNNTGHYTIVGDDDFVYNPRISVTAPFGPVNRNKLGYKGVVSPLYYVFRVHSVDKDFLECFFKTTLWHTHLKNNGNSGARHDRISITDDILKQMLITHPATTEEQKEIAEFVLNIVHELKIQAEIIEQLKCAKESAILSMFPQKGEAAPSVRFKGFSEPWKLVKASQLFKTFNERNMPDLPVLSAFQDNRGMAVREENGYNIAHDRRNEVTYKHVLPGQFVMHLRSFQGGFAHSSVEGITSPAYTVFGFIDDSVNYDYFWKLIFMSKAFIKRLETITYGIRDGRSINFDEFLSFSFLVPSKSEQQKIAEFFQNIDRQIDIQTKILERLKRVKAACLDQMFV